VSLESRRMEISKLMLGDFVRTKDNVRRGHIDRVSMIEGKFIGVLRYDKAADVNVLYKYWCSDVEPITLTPQILEKNGFVWGELPDVEDAAALAGVNLDPNDKGYCYADECGQVKIVFPKDMDGGYVYVSNYTDCVTRSFGESLYVHELQNLMYSVKVKVDINL